MSNGLRICDFCFRESCSLERQEDRCGELIPCLSFLPPLIGLDGTFSTFRASSIWYDRARVVFRSHKTVGLLNAETGERIGTATLKDAVRGPVGELLKRHAHTNHLIASQNMPPAEAATWLTKWISHNMGSRYVKDPTLIGTVLYLERNQAA